MWLVDEQREWMDNYPPPPPPNLIYKLKNIKKISTLG